MEVDGKEGEGEKEIGWREWDSTGKRQWEGEGGGRVEQYTHTKVRNPHLTQLLTTS